ncbi:MAG: V-type ATP synthase subunit K [Spirochaetota bacterium]
MDIGQIGFAACLAFSAMGSGIGAGVAGMSAVGAWKKCLFQNKPAPFMLIVFVGAPLTQTIYGMILMNAIRASGLESMAKLGVGVFGGIAIGLSALFQGKAGASAADAQAETGKGFGNYIMVLGLIETVAIFTMVFLLGTL